MYEEIFNGVRTLKRGRFTQSVAVKINFIVNLLIIISGLGRRIIDYKRPVIIMLIVAYIIWNVCLINRLEKKEKENC